MNASPGDDANRQVFDAPHVIESYATADELSAAEIEMFDRYVPPGSRVVDLGVGTGRTTPRLAAGAATYLGVDVAPRMVERARALHPDQQFVVDDAATLSGLGDETADVVVFSYNGLDYLVPEDRRDQSVATLARILVPGGRLIFSTHDPRALLRRRVPSSGVRGSAVATVQTIRRLADRLPTSAFRSGAGFVNDRAWGGLVTYMAVPPRVIAATEAHGFRHLATLPSQYPAPARSLATEWWYYAFERCASDTSR